MKTSIFKMLAVIFTVATSTSLFAQSPQEKYYGFETGQITTDKEQKKSANWWIQANDVFSISQDQNHTPNGERALMYSNKKRNKAQAMICATYEAEGAPIKLESGTYRAECWVYLEEGSVVDFDIFFPVTKFKDGKRVPEWKAAEVTNPDFESPFRAANFNTSKVEAGKWTKVTTKWYLAYDGVTEVDKLDSFVNIKYPEGAPKAKFYIDDIRILKVE
ncbi:MAG: hypothetical protein SNH27_09985 [Rikenellaceae bacterium]